MNEIINLKEVSVTLKEIHLANPETKKEVLEKREFNFGQLYKDIGKYLCRALIYDIPDDKLIHAQKTIDLWIQDHYKGSPEILNAYEKENVIPQDIEEKLPPIYKPEWEILRQFNQLRCCDFLILDRPIPEFPNLKIQIFCGFKAINGFLVEWSRRYRNITVIGVSHDIDKFLKKYRL